MDHLLYLGIGFINLIYCIVEEQAHCAGKNVSSSVLVMKKFFTQRGLICNTPVSGYPKAVF
jgi:hypothetical protein